MEGEDKAIQDTQPAEVNSASNDGAYEKINTALDRIFDRLDNLEKNRLNARSIKEIAERKVMEKEVAKEEESIRLNRQYAN